VNQYQQTSNEATVYISVLESAPTDTDLTYTIKHDQVLTVSPAGVLSTAHDNDPPDAGHLTASLVNPPIMGTLSDFIDSGGVDHPLLVDGSFVLAPPPHWAGVITFAYAVSDGMYSSPNYTVTVNVTDQAPVAQDDQYRTSWNSGDPAELEQLIVAPRGVQQNDADPDLDPFTSIIIEQPAHGTLSDYIDGQGVDHPLLVDGAFLYTPAVGFSGTDVFAYADTDSVLQSNVATVTITVTKAYMQIRDGQMGFVVPDAKVMSTGAYTVANLNDTQGNGEADESDQNVVPWSAALGDLTQGENSASTSADLSRFRVGDRVLITDGQSTPGTGGYVDNYQFATIASITAGAPGANSTVTFSETFERDYSKAGMRHTGRAEVDLMQLKIFPPTPIIAGARTETVSISGPGTFWSDPMKVNNLGTVISLDVVLIPDSGYEVWIEPGESQSLRDIRVTSSYNGGSYTVSATGIWSTAEFSFNDTYQQLQAKWPDLPPPPATPADLLSIYGATGPLPPSDRGVLNVMAAQFTIMPSRIRGDGTQDGTWENDGIYFDASRQLGAKAWKQVQKNDPWTIDTDFTYPRPTTEEYANDDTHNEDESYDVTTGGHFYVMDAPGEITRDAPFYASAHRWNFNEFLRCMIDEGHQAEGNGVLGSRASDYYPWYSVLTVTADANGEWQRAGNNAIGPGQVVQGNSP
jgi:hypothetical protein